MIYIYIYIYIYSTTHNIAWLGCFFYIGYSGERYNHVMNYLINLELYNRSIVRSYVIASIVVGSAYICIFTGVNSVENILSLSISIAIKVNTGIYWLLNYLIVVFVILCFVSLVARFHLSTLQLYQDSLFAQQLTITAAIQEHVVIMRLIHETAGNIQWIVAPSLILSIAGALLNVYRIVVTSTYSDTYSTIYSLLVTLGILTISMYSCACVTCACNEISRLVMSIDCCAHLIQRQAIIQQLVLMPNNCWTMFSVNVTKTKLMWLTCFILLGIVVVARGY